MLKYLRMGSKRTKAIWWVLIVLTVGTFIGGFIFLFGVGLDTGLGAQMSGAVATVNGQPIGRVEFQNALEEQRQAYRRQYQSSPADQDERMVEAQAFRGLVTQRLLHQKAQKLGLRATDREVVISLQTSPPQALASAPDFQTDGKFDPQKYAAALRNPNNNWTPFEEMVRASLPVRKLQERLAASLKLSQGELKEAFRNRFERVAVTVVQVPPAGDAKVNPPSDADIERVYQKYKGRMSSGPAAQLEVLQVPKKFSDEELRVAREQAKSLVDRARRGEDFASLARDYSEGAGADKGGEINRLFQPSEFGPQLAPKMAALQKGDVSDPVEEAGRFVIFKVIDRIGDPLSPTPNLRVAQIVIKARPSEESLRQQYEAVRKIRDQATRAGLGKAAAENGLATSKTQFFDFNSTPPQLYAVPEAVDWALGAKTGAVSPVYQGLDDFTLAQLAAQRPGGPAAKTEVMDQLRQLAEFEARVRAAKSKADQVAQGLAAGKSLEEAAQAAGLTSFKVEGMSRVQPDPRLGAAPEVVGSAFAAPPGRTLGPFETPAGWYFVRVDAKLPADSTAFNDQIKGQITTEILSRKQQDFFSAWVADQKRQAKIQDMRSR